ncbi:MAG: hypothetical protein LUQ30_04585, partial [Methanothrix sp.]|nr:hypothetical protein [Methanothrix sp.]
ITTLAGGDGIIDIPAGVEFLEEGAAVQVELFSEKEPDPATLLLAGENSILLERLAERRPGFLRLLTASPIQARIYLEEGVADLGLHLRSRPKVGWSAGHLERRDGDGAGLPGPCGALRPGRPAPGGLASGLLS